MYDFLKAGFSNEGSAFFIAILRLAHYLVGGLHRISYFF